MADKIDREELRRLVQEKVQAELAAGRTPETGRVKAEVSRELASRGRKAKQAEVRRHVKNEIHQALRLRRFTARIRYARISPRKMRRVNALIRDKDVNQADAILKTVPQRGAAFQKKLLQSAVANATYLAGQERTDLDVNRLHVVSTQIPPGPIMYRARPSSERHPNRIRKRFSHATVILEERDLPAPKKERGKKKSQPEPAKKPAAAATAAAVPTAPTPSPAPVEKPAEPPKEAKKTARQVQEPKKPTQRATKRQTKRGTKPEEGGGGKKNKGEKH